MHLNFHGTPFFFCENPRATIPSLRYALAIVIGVKTTRAFFEPQLLLQYSGEGINRVLRLLATRERHPVALYCTAGTRFLFLLFSYRGSFVFCVSSVTNSFFLFIRSNPAVTTTDTGYIANLSVCVSQKCCSIRLLETANTSYVKRRMVNTYHGALIYSVTCYMDDEQRKTPVILRRIHIPLAPSLPCSYVTRFASVLNFHVRQKQTRTFPVFTISLIQ